MVINLTAPVVAFIAAIPAVAPVVAAIVSSPAITPTPTTRHSRVREPPAWHGLPRHRILRVATVRRVTAKGTISLPPPLTVTFLLVMLVMLVMLMMRVLVLVLVLLLVNDGARVALPVVVLLFKTVSVVVIIPVLTSGWLVNLIEVGGGG